MPRRRRQPAEESFQMAPMIDMVFLLLVFFMTVSTIARDARPQIDLPVSTTARVPEAALPREIITARMLADDCELYWGSRQVNLDDLQGLLNESPIADIEQVLLRGSAAIPWRVWKHIIDLCRESGIPELIFATYED